MELEDDSVALPSGKRPPPPFVMKCFNAHLVFIKAANGSQPGIKTVNRFYQLHESFWLPRKDTFFLFQLSDITPTILYNPRFFYWDPLLLVDHIPCPKSYCSGKLIRHGYSKRPRGIIDFEDRFWLIGVRYKCNTCSPASTFQSWDPAVIMQLPHSLAAEFPAHLSHRSGVSTAVFAMMRCCFQNGMGAKQMSDAINVLHRRRYEMLEVQYLRMIQERAGMAAWMNKTFLPFPSFTDQGPYGLHAIIPSARWFRDMYDKFMESHEHEIDQYTALLPCRGAAIDHSFKVCIFAWEKTVVTVL